MKVFDSLDKLPEFNKTVFTQGTFDGVHLGHQKILAQLKRETIRIGGESVLLTFWPHPRLLLFPDDNNLKLLQTLDEKLEMMEKCGVDNVVVLPFTKTFSHTQPEDFIKDILVNKLNTNLIIIGYDHRFGRNREGDITLLRKCAGVYNYEVEEIGAEDINHITISSTKIRNALLQGDVETANKYLGRPYSFRGRVIEGIKLGRKLGFPTANILTDSPNKLIPALGIYAVKTLVRGVEYGGMMSIGNNPTVPGKTFSVEVNLFDFSDEIYGEEVEIRVVAWLREEKKFENLEELTLNLGLDKKNALNKIKTI